MHSSHFWKRLHQDFMWQLEWLYVLDILKKQKIAYIRYHLLSSHRCASQSFIIEIKESTLDYMWMWYSMGQEVMITNCFQISYTLSEIFEILSERRYYDFYVSDLVYIDGYLPFSFSSASSTRAIVINLRTNILPVLKFSQIFCGVQAINFWNKLPFNAPSLSVFKHSYTWQTMEVLIICTQ